MLLQFAIGFASGLVVGVAVFSHPFLRAVVAALIAGIIIGGIMIDGVEGYLNWATLLPTLMAKSAWFWLGLIAGFFGSTRVWPGVMP
jgi:hypothetical protein